QRQVVVVQPRALRRLPQSRSHPQVHRGHPRALPCRGRRPFRHHDPGDLHRRAAVHPRRPAAFDRRPGRDPGVDRRFRRDLRRRVRDGSARHPARGPVAARRRQAVGGALPLPRPPLRALRRGLRRRARRVVRQARHRPDRPPDGGAVAALAGARGRRRDAQLPRLPAAGHRHAVRRRRVHDRQAGAERGAPVRPRRHDQRAVRRHQLGLRLHRPQAPRRLAGGPRSHGARPPPLVGEHGRRGQARLPRADRWTLAVVRALPRGRGPLRAPQHRADPRQGPLPRGRRAPGRIDVAGVGLPGADRRRARSAGEALPGPRPLADPWHRRFRLPVRGPAAEPEPGNFGPSADGRRDGLRHGDPAGADHHPPLDPRPLGGLPGRRRHGDRRRRRAGADRRATGRSVAPARPRGARAVYRDRHPRRGGADARGPRGHRSGRAGGEPRAPVARRWRRPLA
ncbi:hypothetical protein FGG08_007666, partial [Glutinoglossum americanum]